MIALRAVGDRLAGILLFLPVPLVLGLFTRQPFGTRASVGLGVVLMATHRLYARPFALARAGRRCLWCGESAGQGPALELVEPSGQTTWRACSAEHEARLARTLGWAVRRRVFLLVGILGTLLLFVAFALATTAGWPHGLRAEDPIAVFRLGVALAVLPFGWLAPSRGPSQAAGGTLPFPVHIQALLGTVWVLWLFRLVGLWWLAAGLLHLIHRLTG